MSKWIGAAMGSPLSPIVANIYMESLETRALETFRVKPKLWVCYVDDTFVLWQHGEEQLETFHEHLNSQHSSIQFTKEVECDNKIPFLDVLVERTGILESPLESTERRLTLTSTSTTPHITIIELSRDQ